MLSLPNWCVSAAGGVSGPRRRVRAGFGFVVVILAGTTCPWDLRPGATGRFHDRPRQGSPDPLCHHPRRSRAQGLSLWIAGAIGCFLQPCQSLEPPGSRLRFRTEGDLRSVTGDRSRYRDAAKIKEVFGIVPANTVNDCAVYADQSDLYRIQKEADCAGCKTCVHCMV